MELGWCEGLGSWYGRSESVGDDEDGSSVRRPKGDSRRSRSEGGCDLSEDVDSSWEASEVVDLEDGRPVCVGSLLSYEGSGSGSGSRRR